jgi:predicted metalloprotease with PDZ domain
MEIWSGSTRGFTEYFANLALIRTGLVTEEDFLHKVAVNVGQYEYFLNSSLFNGVTMRDAGKKKGRYRFGVYASGWIVAFVLDQEIRRHSDNQKSLADLLRLLLESPQHANLTVPMVLDAIQQFAGLEPRKLVESAISTRESIHPDRYLVELGFDVAGQSYQDEYYIKKNENASPEQLSRRKAWTGF